MPRIAQPRNIEVIDDALVEVLRHKTFAEKAAMIFAANRMARVLAAAGARHQHTEWSQAQIDA